MVRRANTMGRAIGAVVTAEDEVGWIVGGSWGGPWSGLGEWHGEAPFGGHWRNA